jgi:hypothetical protein
MKLSSFFLLLALTVSLSLPVESNAQEDATTLTPRRAGLVPTLIHATSTDNNRTRPGTLQKTQEHIRVQKLERKEAISDRKDTLEERKEATSETRELRRAELQEKASNRAKAHIKRIVKRLSLTIDRINTLIERTSSRLTKLEEKGLDIGDAQLLLDNASQSTLAAEEALANLLENLPELERDNRKEFVSHIRTHVEEIKGHLKEAHTNIKEAVRTAKASIQEGRAEDNTTNEE